MKAPVPAQIIMDVRVYYQKLRKIEAAILEPFVVIMSRETPDGGKPGVKTDVARSLAAKLIVEDQAVLANPEETAQFRAETDQRRREAEGLETAGAKRQKRQ